MQMILFIVRRETIVKTLSNTGSFGCLGKASIMAAFANFYLTTTCFLLWLLLVFQFSRFVIIRRLVVNFSLIVGLWASLTFSYAFILYPSFSILACHSFDGQQVLYGDASVVCFDSSHLPWGILALCTLMLLAIPLPVLIVMLRSHPKIKPLVDVYLSFVKDDRYWYIAYGLTRRIVICIISVYVANEQARQVSLAMIILFLFFLHFIIQPYRRPIDNLWEAFFLSFGLAFAILSIVPMPPNSQTKKLAYALYGIPVGSAFLYGAYQSRTKLLVLVELILTALLFPVLLIYYKASGQKFHRISFLPERKTDLGKETIQGDEPLLDGSSRSKEEFRRAKEVYEFRDDIMAEVFQPNK